MDTLTDQTPKYGPGADPDKDDRPELHPPFLLTLKDRTTDEVKDHWPTLQLPKLKKDRAGMKWAWRSVRTDFTSTRGYRWPFPGHWAEASGPFTASKSACPSKQGDGLCLAWSITGAISGGIRLGTGLLCGYLPSDLLGTWDPDHSTDTNKLRLKRAWVAEVMDTMAALTEGSANLRSANLRGASYSQMTLWPERFDPKAAGAIKEEW
jgi:hypothetical protein